jgi:hypothetical protein
MDDEELSWIDFQICKDVLLKILKFVKTSRPRFRTRESCREDGS